MEANPATFSFDYPDSEIVLGVVCAVGADYDKIRDYLVRTLPKFGYRANVLKLSSFIRETANAIGADLDLPQAPEAERLAAYMNAGNRIRKDAAPGKTFSLSLHRRGCSHRGFREKRPNASRTSF